LSGPHDAGVRGDVLCGAPRFSAPANFLFRAAWIWTGRWRESKGRRAAASAASALAVSKAEMCGLAPPPPRDWRNATRAKLAGEKVAPDGSHSMVPHGIGALVSLVDTSIEILTNQAIFLSFSLFFWCAEVFGCISSLAQGGGI